MSLAPLRSHPTLPPCLTALLGGQLSRCHIIPGLPFQALLWLQAKRPPSLSAADLPCKAGPHLPCVTMGTSLSPGLGLTNYKIGMLTRHACQDPVRIKRTCQVEQAHTGQAVSQGGPGAAHLVASFWARRIWTRAAGWTGELQAWGPLQHQGFTGPTSLPVWGQCWKQSPL